MAISLVENDDPEGWALVKEVYPRTGRATVIGFTGPPGAGKSTLVGALTKLERARDRTVAVLSIDPTSPFTHGALLGDRIRLTDHFLDPGVYIRSMASRGALGGLSEASLQAALLMDASGRDVILLETVGVGQAEVDIIDHADTVVLVLMPGSGDSIQALKAGVMEIPDVIVVNKADHPLTDTMVREIRNVLALGPREGWKVPIIKTEAVRGEGVEELAEKLAEHHAYVEAEGTLSERRRRNLMNEVLALATYRMRRELEASVREDPEVQELLDRVVARELDPASAATDGARAAGRGARAMSAALAPPFIVASLLLCVAGVLKLRSPRVAVGALADARAARERVARPRDRDRRTRARRPCVLHPSRAAAATLAGVYARVRAVVAWMLARKRTACGCFGEDDMPASHAHSVASAILASLALAAAASAGSPHGLDWLLDRSAATAAVALIGIGGALYAIVLVYTVLPRAWEAWESE